MRLRTVLLAAVIALPAMAARAQAPVLAPDARIRFAVAPGGRTVTGNVLAQRNDSLWIRRTGTVDTVAVPMSNLARLDVSRGKESHILGSTGFGFVAGAVLGGALGYSVGMDNCNGAWVCIPRGGAAAVGAATFGVMGAGVGALVGWIRAHENWQRVIPASVASEIY